MRRVERDEAQYKVIRDDKLIEVWESKGGKWSFLKSFLMHNNCNEEQAREKAVIYLDNLGEEEPEENEQYYA